MTNLSSSDAYNKVQQHKAIHQQLGLGENGAYVVLLIIFKDLQILAIVVFVLLIIFKDLKSQLSIAIPTPSAKDMKEIV